MPTFGPRLITRDRNRIALNTGKGLIRKKLPDGTRIELDTDPIWGAIADGVAAACAEIRDIAAANAPRDPATPGDRIPESMDYGVWAFGKVIEAGGGRDFRKPRDFRPPSDGVGGVVKSKSRLHHLHELGTVHMAARPYLGPARVAVAPRVPGILRDHFPKDGPR